MKKLTLLLTTFLALSSVVRATPDMDAQAAIAIAIALQQHQTPKVLDPIEIAWNQAAEHNEPLVIFVATKGREIDSCVVVTVPILNSDKTPRILVLKNPRQEEKATFNQFAPSATDSTIRGYLGLEKGGALIINQSSSFCETTN